MKLCKLVRGIKVKNGKKKVKQSHYRPWQALQFPGGWGSQILRQSAREGSKFVSPTHRPSLPQEICLVLISVRMWVDPRAIVRTEGLCKWKNSSDSIGNRTCDLPVCSAAPQPLRVPQNKKLGVRQSLPASKMIILLSSLLIFIFKLRNFYQRHLLSRSIKQLKTER
jgi:hypothetical protein